MSEMTVHQHIWTSSISLEPLAGNALLDICSCSVCGAIRRRLLYWQRIDSDGLRYDLVRDLQTDVPEGASDAS